MQKIVFSGTQPTGNLHLGNYLGSILNWINLQTQHNCFFGIMDLHSITSYQDPYQLKENIVNCAITYIACGIDPDKSTLFIQSEIKEHTELAWILSSITALGRLNRMTQFKDKSANIEARLGLYSYPVLMAADILLYNTNLVPTGEDQKQHIELTRDIAETFNREFKIDYFKIPISLMQKNSLRIMSLTNANDKMSKSNISDLSRINLSDNPDIIIKKIKKSKTDSITGISYNKTRKELFNLLNIFSTCTDKTPEEIANYYKNINFSAFKTDLAQALIDKLTPIRNKISDLKNNKDYVIQSLKTGREKAQEVASKNISKIKEIVGLFAG